MAANRSRDGTPTTMVPVPPNFPERRGRATVRSQGTLFAFEVHMDHLDASSMATDQRGQLVPDPREYRFTNGISCPYRCTTQPATTNSTALAPVWRR